MSACIQEEDATECFFRFRVRTIGDFDLVVLHAQRDGVADGIESLTADEVPTAAKYVVVSEAFLHHALRFRLGNLGKFILVDES